MMLLWAALAGMQASAPAPVPTPLTAAAPSPEAMRLARRVAQTGSLVSILPMIVEQDLTGLADERPQLTDTQRAALIATGRRIAAEDQERIVSALATGYARRLSMSDLATLAAAADTPAARAKRAADLPVTAEMMQTVGSLDLRKKTAARFCADTGVFCDRK